MKPRAHLIWAALAFPLAAASASAATCESLSSTSIKDTTITLAGTVAAGAFTLPPDATPPAVPVSYAAVPAFCRVAGVIKPSSDSSIAFEVWMPSSGWNGKFQGIGNGGFAGVINYGPNGGLAGAVSRGYAAASTDTGHHAEGIDARWALGHKEKLIDYGYRAIHLMTENAKTIVTAFYGNGPRRSYFDSCSNGGRQALMEAQRFPADYDGIVAGAPANFFTHLGVGFLWDAKALAEDGSFIPPAKLPAIEAAALAACDARDGVKDGVIDDPAKCKFDPSTLLCRAAESDSCLTQPQVTALEKIYAGARNSRGERLFPGWPPGGETGRGGWAAWVTGVAPEKSLQFIFGTQLFSEMVFQNPAWDFHTFNIDRDTQTADEKLSGMLNATDPNLKRFKDRGGKLILYHGWSDGAISALNTIDYYKNVASGMGQSNADSFMRLFMMPGMQHCGGGPGPNVFTQPGTERDAEHDIDKALERWVEQGTPPEKIVATKYKTDGERSSGVVRTRPLCAYPATAQYKGSGSTDDASSFACAPGRP